MNAINIYFLLTKSKNLQLTITYDQLPIRSPYKSAYIVFIRKLEADLMIPNTRTNR